MNIEVQLNLGHQTWVVIGIVWYSCLSNLLECPSDCVFNGCHALYSSSLWSEIWMSRQPAPEVRHQQHQRERGKEELKHQTNSNTSRPKLGGGSNPFGYMKWHESVHLSSNFVIFENHPQSHPKSTKNENPRTKNWYFSVHPCRIPTCFPAMSSMTTANPRHIPPPAIRVF